MITPRFAMVPFPEAVRELMGTQSLRAFAAKVPMDHRELSRLMRGVSKLDCYVLERIAKAGDVTPAFFMEWRTLRICEVLSGLFAAQPNLSVQALKAMEGL
jgi:transcriptional regulator with XRE-family HTH domain